MPMMKCELDGKPGMKWGEGGDCHTYTEGDEASVAAAKAKCEADAAKMKMHAVIFATDAPVQAQQAEDGTYSIFDVPVFELGQHRGFNYSDEWAAQAVANFNALRKDRGYRVPVIVGHTKDDTEEKPAVGFMDNLRVIGKRLVADMAHIGKEVFDQIKAGQWPYRSIEVFDRAAQITALALLGGTPPYMKTPPLLFGAERGIWVQFNAPDKEPEMANEGSGGTPGVTAEQFAASQAENALLKARLEASEKETKARFAAQAEELRQGRAKEFIADLRALGIAPGVIDSPELKAFTETLSGEGVKVKFADGEKPGLGALQQFMGMITEQARKGAFLKPEPGERAGVSVSDGIGGTQATDDDKQKFGANVDSESLALTAQATALVATKKYDHLPTTALRFRQAFKDITAGRTTA